MKAFTMFNAPLSAAYFLDPAWEGTKTGDLVEHIQDMMEQMNKGVSNPRAYLEQIITTSLEDFEQEAHFQHLRHGLLKPAMLVLTQNRINMFSGRPIPSSSQVVFTRYLTMLNGEYIVKENGKWVFKIDQFYKDYYHNIDLWGWAVTVGSLVSGNYAWATPEQNNRIRLGAAKLIYYLFSHTGFLLDTTLMTDMVHEMMAPGSPKFVYPTVKQEVDKKPKSLLESKTRPRRASSSKVSLFTPSGSVPKGMLKGLTKKGQLTVAHREYINTLGRRVGVKGSKTKKLSPISEGQEPRVLRRSTRTRTTTKRYMS
jgi:hypothetical protein